MDCPVDGCGEAVTPAELSDHLELHAAEGLQGHDQEGNDNAPQPRLYDTATFEDPGPLPSRPSSDSANAKAKWREILHMPQSTSTLGAGAPRERVRLGVSGPLPATASLLNRADIWGRKQSSADTHTRTRCRSGWSLFSSARDMSVPKVTMALMSVLLPYC